MAPFSTTRLFLLPLLKDPQPRRQQRAQSPPTPEVDRRANPTERVSMTTWLLLGGRAGAKRPTHETLLQQARQKRKVEEAKAAWREARAAEHDKTTGEWGMVGPLGAVLDAVGGNARPEDWIEWHRGWKAEQAELKARRRAERLARREAERAEEGGEAAEREGGEE